VSGVGDVPGTLAQATIARIKRQAKGPTVFATADTEYSPGPQGPLESFVSPGSEEVHEVGFTP
jgi:hypothetical protein